MIVLPTLHLGLGFHRWRWRIRRWSRYGGRRRSRAARCTATALHSAATTAAGLSVARAQTSSAHQRGRKTARFQKRQHVKTLSKSETYGAHTRTQRRHQQERQRETLGKRSLSARPLITLTARATHTRGATDNSTRLTRVDPQRRRTTRRARRAIRSADARKRSPDQPAGSGSLATGVRAENSAEARLRANR